MKFSIRFADQIVGTLTILALVALVFVIFMLGRSQRWFTHDPQYIAHFNSASGLSNNMPVLYRGFTIGHVKKISLTEDDRVEVSFSIFDEHSQRVKEGSLVEVQVSPIGLGNSFVFYAGRGNVLIPEGMEIPDVNSERGKRILAAGMADRQDSGEGINSMLSQVPGILENLKTLTGTVNTSLEGSEGADELALGKIINNVESATAGISNLAKSINDQLSPILYDVKDVTDQLSDPTGTLMSILGTDGSLYTNLHSSIESLSGIVKNLEKTSEFLPSLVPQINVIISDINGVIRTAQNVLESVANNPLLRGGIPEHRESNPGSSSPRNIEF